MCLDPGWIHLIAHPNNKRWFITFTCTSVWAFKVELMESIDTLTFINHLKRFFTVCGPVWAIRSDRGTNFIGADSSLQKFPSEPGWWIFNLPSSPHVMRTLGNNDLRYKEDIILHASAHRILQTYPWSPYDIGWSILERQRDATAQQRSFAFPIMLTILVNNNRVCVCYCKWLYVISVYCVIVL